MSGARKKRSVLQKKILKDLIDADMNMADVAKLHGHTRANVSLHFLRENESYFKKAIVLSKEEQQTDSV